MYATVLMITMENADYDQMHQTAINARENLNEQKGFVSAAYYSDRDKGEYGVTVVFETLEDLEAARNARPPEIREMMSQYAVENTYFVNNAFSAGQY